MNRISHVNRNDEDFDWEEQEEATARAAGSKVDRQGYSFPQPRLAEFNAVHGSVLHHSDWDQGLSPVRPPFDLTIATYWWS